MYQEYGELKIFGGRAHPALTQEICDYLNVPCGKLAAFDNHTLGAQLEISGELLGLTGRNAGLRGQIVIEYIDSDTTFGNAVVAHAALTVPIEY